MAAKGTSDFEIIQAWYLQQGLELRPHDKPIILTAQQIATRDRWQEVWEKLSDTTEGNRQTKGQVKKWVMDTHGVSHTQALVIVNSASQLFGDTVLLPKKTARAVESMELEKCIEQLQQDYFQQYIEPAEYYKLLLQYKERLHKLNDLDNPEIIDPKELLKELELAPAMFTTDPKVLEELAIEIDFEDLTDDED